MVSPAAAQVHVDALTEVSKIEFEGVHSVSEHSLRAVLRTRDRGPAYGLRVALAKIPLVPDPARHVFRPLTLQEDVVRVRAAYAAAGFFRAQVRYEIERDESKNLIAITLMIEEGDPTILVAVAVTSADSLSALPVPEDERDSWQKLERSALKQRGQRLIVDDVRKTREKLARWWRDRGYPRARVRTSLAADSVRYEGRIAYRVHVGTPARFGEIHIEGNRNADDATIRRQVGIEPGEPYSEAVVRRAELDVKELDIVRVAKVDVPAFARDSTTDATRVATTDSAGATPDSVGTVQVRITEADPRLIGGDLGYVTDAGLSAEARWTHRDFSGGGRSLTVTTLAQTGWLSLTENPDERYRLAVSLKQPGFLHRRISGLLTPFVEHRDDTQDRSTQVGLNTTLVYKLRQLTSVSLDYQVALRHIDEYRFEDLASGEIDLLTFLTQVSQGLLDSLGTNLQSSTFTLSGGLGTLDDPANPRRGVIVRPVVQVTAPTAISSTAYWRLGASANGFVPLSRSATLAARVAFGRLLPFGKSLPGVGDDPQTKFLQLRDAAFTAGGTGDVRGWENRLLGPKVPDVRFETVGDSLVPHADGYVPYGGFQRLTFSLELRLPIPGLGQNFGSLLFLDGGQVRTDDERFGLAGDDPNGQEKVFVATGAGFTLRTPVGPIEVSAGYKLNPSITDLVDSADILASSTDGRPLDQLPRHNSRRWQLHLAIGASY